MANEILDLFLEESTALIHEMEEIVEKIEDSTSRFPRQELEDYSQRIDRMMGAAKIIALEYSNTGKSHPGLERIARISELCKALGYKAASLGNQALVPVFAAFFADAIDVIKGLMTHLENLEESEKQAKAFSSTLEKRLEWLVTKIGKSAPPASVSQIQELMWLLQSTE